MADPTKGTDQLDSVDESSWFVVEEAECVDENDSFEDLFEQSTEGSNISNLIDDDVDEVDEGNSLALYNSQITKECNRAIAVLKRKYAKSPEGPTVADLSPRLQAVTISPQRLSKRRLFEDSGIEGDDEATNSVVQVETQVGQKNGGSDTVATACEQLLNANCKRSHLLFKFQSLYSVPYTELTRAFKSDKTCCDNWVVFVYAAQSDVLEASKTVLQQYCECMQVILLDFNGLYLLQFKHGKNRETVMKLFCTVMNVQDTQLLADPPKSRSVAAALFFYKKSIVQTSFVFNMLPAWVTNLTMVNHQTAATAETFELAKMVQWAYDNRITEEPEIAYNYALLANEDMNAAAFLKSNCQVKYVKDCSTMVKLYFRQEMREMSISQWIYKCCNECEGDADWKVIANYLKYQRINVVSFLTSLRLLFKRIPKKNCILFYGPPDTGKSFFSFSLIKFLRGRVISYMNKNSQFWLSPLLDCKVGLLDDATYSCWLYIDSHMRNALDGNLMCIDSKHRAPTQIHLPPLIITSNTDVLKDENLKYLHSRIMAFEFPEKMPFDSNGNPIYMFTDAVWKCFFKRLSKQLDLEEEDESSTLQRTFRCTSECPDEHS